MPSFKRALTFAALLLLQSNHVRAETLYDDLGAKPGIERIITHSMTIWGADPRVAPTFEDTNLPRFKRLIVDQICMITGGNCRYTGRSMSEAHKGLHLTRLQFNAVAEDLQIAMEQLDIAGSVQNRLLALLAPMQRDVVTR